MSKPLPATHELEQTQQSIILPSLIEGLAANDYTNGSLVQLLPPPLTMTETALTYVKSGLSVIPIKKDKLPALAWKPFQTRLPQINEITSWWPNNNHSIAIICGKVSDRLEVIDFDEKYNIESESLLTQWQALVEKELPGFIAKLPVQKTVNNGYHVLYRCSQIDGNQKLAMRSATKDEVTKDPNAKSMTLIETRGEGGYALCYPSPGYAICNGNLTSIPIITPEEREILLSCAKAINRFIEENDVVRENKRGLVKNRPGDAYNEKGSHRELLEKHGWTYVGEDEKNEQWCRPGKKNSVSATLLKDKKYFYVFSSNAPNLDSNKSYDLFSLYTSLEHSGNYSDAAKALALQGYGTLGPTEASESKIVLVEKYLTERYEFRMNVITQRVEYRMKTTGDYVQISDTELNSLFRELHHNSLPVTIDALQRVLNSDFSEPYDPFKEYFENQPQWDGSYDYIEELAGTIKLKEPKDEPALKQCLRRWIVGQVACAIDPNATNHTAIILVGEQQGAGKTTWLNRLIPPPLAKYKFVGTINPENKDTLIYLSETILINLDELETLRKAEIGALKTVMTLPSIKVRRPYGHYPIDMTRRASFVGSINNTEFLNDPTGSRRFLTFEVQSVDYAHTIDMNCVYRQAYALYKQGERYWFKENEIAEINERNKRHTIQSYEHELLQKYCEHGNVSMNEGEWYTSTEVANRIQQHDIHYKVDAKSVRNIGCALVAENYLSKKSQGVKKYYVKS